MFYVHAAQSGERVKQMTIALLQLQSEINCINATGSVDGMHSVTVCIPIIKVIGSKNVFFTKDMLHQPS